MGAIQGSINGMIGAAAVGLGAKQHFEQQGKTLDITRKNETRLSQFIRDSNEASARADKALQDMQKRFQLTETAVK